MKTPKMKNPHDHFFKESMERKNIAYAFILKFLAKDTFPNIDFRSLRIVKDIWIDSELSKHEADIVYSAKITNSSQRIYFLFEHKSFLDDQVFIQINRYISEIHEQLKKELPKTKKYPIVIPCVVYHGRKNWIYGNNINRSFEYINGIEKYIPNYQIEIIELSKADIDFKSSKIGLIAMLFALKYGRGGQVNNRLTLLLDRFENCTDAQFDYLLVVLKYLLIIVHQKFRKKFLSIINTHNLGKNRNMKSIADSLIEEGEKKGIRIGVRKGETTGIKKGESIGIRKGTHTGIKIGSSETVLVIAKRMVKKGFDDKTIRAITHLTQKQIGEIKANVK